VFVAISDCSVVSAIVDDGAFSVTAGSTVIVPTPYSDVVACQ
jgi:hypothetical protein